MTDIIEGEVRELDEPRALVPVQPGQVIVTDTTPVDMLERASGIATALAAMVERQKLYTVISGKKYPHVEAWQTIGRMDNVVAREASAPIRHDDGSYEAFVELIRLSDGLVIGSASALCGAAGDIAGKNDWTKRADHHKRSMAVTRATSRAFRLQYAWIMALAGYEPTPADEMPDDRGETHAPEPTATHDGGLIGTVTKGKPPVDLELRQTPDGAAWGFKLAQGRKGIQALAVGPLADVLAMSGLTVDTRVTIWGRIDDIPWKKDGKDMTPYQRVAIERIQTPEFTLPASDSSDQPAGLETPPADAPSPGQEAFDLSDAALGVTAA